MEPLTRAGGTRYHVRSFVTVPGANSYSQADMHADFCRRIRSLPGAEELRERIQTVYDRSAVDTRHLELPIDEIDRRRETMGWHPIVREVLLSLGRRALDRVFSGPESDTRVAECDALIVVASNFDGFPGPSRLLAEAMGFRPDAVFYDLGSQGCGGANHAIHLAQMLLETGRCKTVCLLCVDALGTHIQSRIYGALPSLSEIVARVLPSDGAAALILSSAPEPRPVFSYGSGDLQLHAWRDSTDYGCTRTGDDGEPYGQVAKHLRDRVAEETSGLVGILDDPICVHPGGIAILRNLAPSVGPSIEISAAVLREHGNMGAPTVLFVLAKALELGMRIEPRLRLLAFGPSLYTTLYCFDDVALVRSGA